MKLQTFVNGKPQQRTKPILQKLEQDIRNLEKIKQRNAIRVERLLSINLKDVGYVCNYSMTIENRVESRQCFRSRKKISNSNWIQMKITSSFEMNLRCHQIKIIGLNLHIDKVIWGVIDSIESSERCF